MQALADGLLAAEYDEQGLRALLRRAGELTKEVEYYICAAVHDARTRGASWETVAEAASVSAATARGRWADKTVERRLALRATERAVRTRDAAAPVAQLRGESQKARQPSERSASKLGAALSHLHRRSTLTMRQVADQTGLSPSYVSRILSGERVPAWPVVRALADLFGGDPDELTVLWENAQGLTPMARQPIPDATARLKTALRGLYLAAASPPYSRIHDASGQALSVPVIKDILNGQLVPEWKTTVTFVRALGGTPADIRPLWEAVHYAFLVVMDPPDDDTDPPTPP
ncbi:helix-turn-helix domain-containing protein [Streptomyces acidicola]|uniref:helix-turn-helix domain-containing protein n=1 Tax=Streptomyces acidicola TaxID=2596892 RepID=UPI00342D8755